MPSQFKSVHHRHHRIKQNHIGLAFVNLLQTLRTTESGHAVNAMFCQHSGKNPDVDRFIIDDHHKWLHGYLHPFGML